VSFEEPGDGVRCDHCNRYGDMYANRGERLCLACLNRAVDAEINEPVGWAQVPARDYVVPREYRYR
jgi:hypothetical protein